MPRTASPGRKRAAKADASPAPAKSAKASPARKAASPSPAKRSPAKSPAKPAKAESPAASPVASPVVAPAAAAPSAPVARRVARPISEPTLVVAITSILAFASYQLAGLGFLNSGFVELLQLIPMLLIARHVIGSEEYSNSTAYLFWGFALSGLYTAALEYASCCAKTAAAAQSSSQLLAVADAVQAGLLMVVAARATKGCPSWGYLGLALAGFVGVAAVSLPLSLDTVKSWAPAELAVLPLAHFARDVLSFLAALLAAGKAISSANGKDSVLKRKDTALLLACLMLSKFAKNYVLSTEHGLLSMLLPNVAGIDAVVRAVLYWASVYFLAYSLQE